MRRRVRVAIFSTGDEIVEPGAPLPAAGLYDANRELLRGLLSRLDAEVSDLGILRDDREKLVARLAEAAQGQDLVLTSGGVSTGEADYVQGCDRRGGLAGVLARRDQARPAGRDGRAARDSVRRAAGQSGRGVRDIRARGAAAAVAARRCDP